MTGHEQSETGSAPAGGAENGALTSARPVRTVSIALATYNGSRFLLEQLNSFLVQTRLPDELVVGDDSSSDDTVSILEEFAGRAPFPVRIHINRPNLGPSENFAATVIRCSGDVIFLSDQDDIWLPEKLATMVGYLDAHPTCLLATHDAALVDASGQSLGRTLGGQIEDAGGPAGRDLIAGCCMAIDSRLAALFHPMPRMRNHDAWLASAADALQVRGHIAIPLMHYRRHGSNVSQSYMSEGQRASRWLRFQDRIRRARHEAVLVSLETSAAARQDLVLALHRQRRPLAQVTGAATVASAIEVVSRRLAADLRRAATIRAPAMQRPALFLKSARAGDYSGIDGLFSMLRDLRGSCAGRSRK